MNDYEKINDYVKKKSLINFAKLEEKINNIRILKNCSGKKYLCIESKKLSERQKMRIV